jgi:SAM-dependent methyltransferase
MKHDALRVYSKPEPYFQDGEKVYLHMGTNISGPFTVKESNFNTISKIFMYEFEETEILVGEIYLKNEPDDDKLTLRECMHDDSGIAEEIIASAGKLYGGRGINGQLGLQFFQPDRKFIEWIKTYARNRLIIEVGCGTGIVLMRLMDAGARICGIEPYWDDSAGMEMNMNRIKANQDMIHILSRTIEDLPNMYVGRGDKVLLLFCRPCHSDFVSNTLEVKDKETEVLYITLPENMEKYNDLGQFHERAVLLQHEGRSVEKEQVYSVY